MTTYLIVSLRYGRHGLCDLVKTAEERLFSGSDSTPARAETTRHAAFTWTSVSAHRQKRSNLRKDHYLEVFALPLNPSRSVVPDFPAPWPGQLTTRLTLTELLSRCQTSVQRSALTASLADLNSYNKPFRVAQAKPQTFSAFDFKNQSLIPPQCGVYPERRPILLGLAKARPTGVFDDRKN